MCIGLYKNRHVEQIPFYKRDFFSILLGNHKGAAGSLRVLGVAAVSTGRGEESERLTRQSVDSFRAAGDRVHAAEALINLGYALMALGRLAEAHACLDESVTIYSDLGFSGSSSSISLATLGWADLLLGRYGEAGTRVQEALDLSRERGYYNGIGLSLLVLGMLAIAKTEYAQAQQILQPLYSAIEEGQPVGILYLLFPIMGYAARGLGQPDRARQYLCEALRLANGVSGFFSPAARALLGIALLLADEGKVERAVELHALVSCDLYVANSRLYEDVAGRHIATAAKTLPPDVVAAAQERGRGRDLWDTVEELLVELEAPAG